MTIKISAMDADLSVTGVELIPVSDAGATKSVTISNIKDFIIAQIEAIGVLAAVDGNDFVLMLENGTDLKPTDIDKVAQHAIDTIWGKVAEATPDDADIMALKDGGTVEKTVTLANLATYVMEAIEARLINLADVADGSGSIATTDYMLVTQTTTGKRIQISNIITLVYAALVAHINDLAAADATADGDLFYTLQSGVAKKVTLAEILAHAGTLIDGTGTADYLAQWVDADTLKAGPTIALFAAGFAAGSDTVIPTTKCVRKELDELINDQTDIGAALADADTFLVDDGGAGTQKKSTMLRVYSYILDPIFPPAVDGTLSAGANDLTPTAKLVYAKTATATGEVITLQNGVEYGQTVSIYLAALGAGDTAIITPVTAISYSTITLAAQYDIATLQWHGATVGWALLYTNGTVA